MTTIVDIRLQKVKRIQLLWHGMWLKKYKGPIKGLTASGPMGAQSHCSFVHSFIYSFSDLFIKSFIHNRLYTLSVKVSGHWSSSYWCCLVFCATSSTFLLGQCTRPWEDCDSQGWNEAAGLSASQLEENSNGWKITDCDNKCELSSPG